MASGRSPSCVYRSARASDRCISSSVRSQCTAGSGGGALSGVVLFRESSPSLPCFAEAGFDPARAGAAGGLEGADGV
ncbi:DUF543 domain-containing protein [Acidobacteria bacterium AB60]|nr:DUF543 domain-containing protein [Acidobacteria bacterium AB60]